LKEHRVVSGVLSSAGRLLIPCSWSVDGEAALTNSSPGTRDQQSPRRRGTQLLATTHGVGRHIYGTCIYSAVLNIYIILMISAHFWPKGSQNNEFCTTFKTQSHDLRVYCVRTGLLVDHTDSDLMSAFRLMMQQHNNKKTRGEPRPKVTDETLMLPMDNSFSVGTAST